MTTLGAIGTPKALEPKGFDTLVREQHRRLLAYALALTRREDVAEDLVQDALLIAHRDLGKFDAARDFGAWVRGIVRMKYLEWTRSRRTERMTESQLEDLDARHREWDRAAEEGRGDALEALRLCREELGEHIAETLDLFYAGRHSCADIAQRLQVSEVVVRKRLQRARDVLGDCLQKRLDASHGS
ncbi:MAG: sigma-70 family RNA polymerase sigma factor [Planctomycetaceae bacterium]|nr:sigma-70 family RNA polymerase sigma factor [Planctomycetaceae bacterium]